MLDLIHHAYKVIGRSGSRGKYHHGQMPLPVAIHRTQETVL